jgi:transglutaminase-like putative cysteine protease
MKKYCALLLALSLLVIPRMLSAEYSQVKWRPVNYEQAMALAAGADARRYPNSDVVDLARKTFVHYQADGRFDEYYELYAKILSEKGRREFSSVSSSFTLPYNETEFKVVEVIHPDGRRVAVDLERNSRVTVEQSQMDTNIYNPNSRVLSVTLPEVQIGDTVHFIMYDRFARVRVPGTFSDFVTFEGERPIIRAEYTVAAPKALPLKSIALKSEIEGSVSFTQQHLDNQIIYRWTARDVPRAFKEPDMPPLYTQAQRLLVSTVKDWQALSRWYWQLCKPAIEDDTPEMAAKVREITAGIDDPMEKIRRLFRWVSQEIRYLGITVEEEAPGYEPHPVSLTFKRRAGVCRDKAALLTAMLRLAGLDAYPVLMMNGPRKDEEVPQPYFNHAITAVRLEEGSYVLMDATDENTKELLPAYLNNQSYLVALPHGDMLRTSPVEPAENNMMQIRSHGRFKDNDLLVDSTLDFKGVNDNAYRGFFARLNAHERLGYFEKIIKKSAPTAILEALSVYPANMQDTSTPLKVWLSLKIKDYGIEADDMTVLPGLQMGESLGLLNYILGDMGLKQRKYPLLTGHTCGVDETLEIDLPDRLQGKITLPGPCEASHATHTWQQNTVLTGGRLISHDRLTLDVTEFQPPDYAALQKNLAAVAAARVRKTVITPQADHLSGNNDAVILEDINRFEVEPDGAWTEIKTLKLKVLNYAGRKRFGDVHIAFNPAWDAVTVERAAVTTPDGRTLEASKKEINVMDAPWAGMAPRYPASKIMVVSLPGITEGCVIDLKVRKKKTGRPFFSINENYIADDRPGSRTQEHRFFLFADGVFGRDVPIRDKRVQIVMPAAMALHVHKVDPGSVIKSEVKTSLDGSREYTFNATDMAAQLPETDMVPGYSRHPVVHASTGNPEEFARELNRMLVEAAAPDPKIKTLALELVKGINDTRDRIRVIRDHVSLNVNNIHWDIFNMPRISPAAETLGSGYGNSCDRAVLLFSLLEAAGLKPEFVLPSSLPEAGSLNQPFAKAPSRQIYIDLLVRVNTRDGWIYLGDTDHYAALGTTGYDGHPGLGLKNGRRIMIHGLSQDYANRSETHVQMDLDSTGKVRMTIERRYWGTAYARMNKRFSEQTPEERRRYHEELISDLRMGAHPTGSYVTDFDVYPGVERFSVEVDDFAARQNGFVALDLPFMIRGIAGAERDKRFSPLFRDTPKSLKTEICLHISDTLSFTRVMPAEKQAISVPELGKITMARNIRGQEMTIEQQIDLDAGVINPWTYPELVNARHEVADAANRTLILKIEGNRH